MKKGIDLRLRRKILRVLDCSRRGHVPSAFSIVEILKVLYGEVLRCRPGEPAWEDRDRFILSKGHGCLALYVLLAEKGFFPEEELARFCRPGGILGGHPEYGKVPGVEFSTGSLGHGLSFGVGTALAARMDGKDRRTFVLMGDGECQEGSVWEAAMCAGKHRLAGLTAMIDYNKRQAYGPVCEVQDLEPLARKWESFNWEVVSADGHDEAAVREAFGRLPLSPEKPSLIIFNTVKGRGIAALENDPSWHHKSGIKDDAMKALCDALGADE
ncbi:MAG TPA: transketolase [Elusimicrobiales bacterium]|nr:transketolase [Elusimicrobiales bacterium]